MLKNTATNLYHPIMYIKDQVSAYTEANVTRYKSRGHRTGGLESREEALKLVQTELVEPLEKQGYEVTKDLENDSEWDGLDIPVDTQLRIIK